MDSCAVPNVDHQEVAVIPAIAEMESNKMSPLAFCCASIYQTISTLLRLLVKSGE
jgi:hypothetical protein